MKYQISEIYLFGSYAREEATADSDIDLVINSENIHGLLQLINFKNDVSDKLDLSVDVLTLRSLTQSKEDYLKKDFYKKFEQERIDLFE